MTDQPGGVSLPPQPIEDKEDTGTRVAPSVPCVVGQDLPQRGQRGEVTAAERTERELIEQGRRVVSLFINTDLNGVICSHADSDQEGAKCCSSCKKLWRRAYAFERAAETYRENRSPDGDGQQETVDPRATAAEPKRATPALDVAAGSEPADSLPLPPRQNELAFLIAREVVVAYDLRSMERPWTIETLTALIRPMLSPLPPRGWQAIHQLIATWRQNAATLSKARANVYQICADALEAALPPVGEVEKP